jgi:hypothetical protein
LSRRWVSAAHWNLAFTALMCGTVCSRGVLERCSAR